MVRVVAPEPVTGRVVGLSFTSGVAVVDEPLARPVELWLRTHGYRIVPVVPSADTAEDVEEFL